jgi:hypothetical protein
LRSLEVFLLQVLAFLDHTLEAALLSGSQRLQLRNLHKEQVV